MTHQVLPKVSLSIYPLFYHIPLVSGIWAIYHFLNTPVPIALLYLLSYEMPTVNPLLSAEVLSVLLGLTQVPSLPSGPPKFHWLEFSFFSQFSQDMLPS